MQLWTILDLSYRYDTKGGQERVLNEFRNLCFPVIHPSTDSRARDIGGTPVKYL